MFRYIVLLALVPAFALATSGVGICEDKTQPNPTYINVEGCEETPCAVALNSTVRMVVGFTAPRDIESFSPTVRAGVLGFFIDYALPKEVSDGCSNLEGGRCPLTAGEDVVYNFEFSVDGSYPQISVEVDLSGRDNEGKAFFCVRVPIKVVAQQ